MQRTWAEVASECGYRSRQAAAQAVERLDSRHPPESVESARRRAVDRLRIVDSVLLGRFADAARRDDDQAVALFAREIRGTTIELSKLLGLYAPPPTQQVDVSVSMTPAAIIDRMEADLLALARSNQNIIEGEVVP